MSRGLCVQCLYEYFDRYLFNFLTYIILYLGKQAVWNVCVMDILIRVRVNILIDSVQLYYTYVGKQTVGACVNIFIYVYMNNSNISICFICFSKLITQYSYICYVCKPSECRIWFIILPLWTILDSFCLTHQFMTDWLLFSNKYESKQFFLIWSFGWEVMR